MGIFQQQTSALTVSHVNNMAMIKIACDRSERFPAYCACALAVALGRVMKEGESPVRKDGDLHNEAELSQDVSIIPI